MSNPITKSGRKRKRQERDLMINAVKSAADLCYKCSRIECREMDGAVEVCSDFSPELRRMSA